MSEPNLTRVDLNLLVVFDALMRERHVGHAAERLLLSQSATSHALNRLRALFDDPLFTRHPRGVEPTPRARELAEPIADVLAHVRGIMQPVAPFDPGQARRTFRIAAHDLSVLMVIAPIMSELITTAPGVEFRTLTLDPETVVDELDRGNLDLALGPFDSMPKAREIPQRIEMTPLSTDEFFGVARRGHPGLEHGRMSLETFVDLPHARVSWDGSVHGPLDDALHGLGHRRRVVLTVRHFLALPFVIGSSDLICALPRRAAEKLAETAALTLFPLPVTIDPFITYILVSRQLAGQPDLAWLCKMLLKAGNC
ncbi:LysR family transcriptional regulator [Streptomyces sp. NPDC090499]|uniref:LysR family transcriptional regulator n=1 Tax=unclassified Streptomyces TaxID=2593676 RepID=UPI003805D0B1